MITKPKGTYDILGGDAKRIQQVNNLVDYFCEMYNYEYIRTPIFEVTELFHRCVGEETDIVSKETYDFVDRSDRELTLRPEGTAGVVRSFIENKMYGDALPKKFYYNGTMYRYERPGNGRNREFTQFGIEILGSNDPATDAEVISLPYYLFQTLGFKNILVKLNNLGAASDRENYKNHLVEYLKPHLSEMCPDCQNRILTNPLRILDCKIDGESDILKNAPSILDYQSEESTKRFNKVLEYLRLMDVDYEIDPRIVRGLDYYDYTVFEIVCDSKLLGGASILAGGGRYNGLVEKLGGPSTPGMGFASGIERIMIGMSELNENIEKQIDCYILAINEEEKLKCLIIAQNLRLNSITCDFCVTDRTLKSQFKEADRFKAKQLIILNSENLNKGLINVKDNLSKEETLVDESEIVEYILGVI